MKSGVSNTAGGAGGTAATGDIRINGGTGSDGQTGSSLLTGNGGASYFGGGGRAGSQAGIAGAAPDPVVVARMTLGLPVRHLPVVMVLLAWRSWKNSRNGLHSCTTIDVISPPLHHFSALI